MANEKIKKVIFTLICVVLLSSMVLVAYAVWDDVAGKKTNEMNVTTGNNSELSCTATATATTNEKKLAPDKTVNYGGTSTAANSSYYLAWEVKPVLTNVRNMEITINTIVLTFNNASNAAVAEPEKILSWWIQDVAPTAVDGIVTKPGTVVEAGAKLTSGKTYYFVVKFTSGIDDTTALYKNHSIKVDLSMSAAKVS